MKNGFSACFRHYIRQPNDHTDKATLLPFALNYLLIRGPFPGIFPKNIKELEELKHSVLFMSRPF